MNGLKEGDRVVSVRPLTGIPVNTFGTVTAVLAFNVAVRFDGHADDAVVAPSAVRRLSDRVDSASRGRAKLADVERGFFWLDPAKRAPSVATPDDIVAVTVTRNVLSVLFNNAEVALRGEIWSGTWIGSAEFPVIGKASALRAHMRGFVEVDERSRATVVLDIGGSIHVRSYERAQDIFEEVGVPVGSADIITITMVLIVERQPGSSPDAFLAIDSLDIVVA